MDFRPACYKWIAIRYRWRAGFGRKHTIPPAFRHFLTHKRLVIHKLFCTFAPVITKFIALWQRLRLKKLSRIGTSATSRTSPTWAVCRSLRNRAPTVRSSVSTSSRRVRRTDLTRTIRHQTLPTCYELQEGLRRRDHLPVLRRAKRQSRLSHAKRGRRGTLKRRNSIHILAYATQRDVK